MIGNIINSFNNLILWATQIVQRVLYTDESFYPNLISGMGDFDESAANFVRSRPNHRRIMAGIRVPFERKHLLGRLEFHLLEPEWNKMALFY